MITRRLHVLGITILAFLVLASVGQAQTTVTLAWNPNSESDLAGYIVQYGTVAGNPSTNVDVGNVTSRQFSGLQVGITYYFRVVAYNTTAQQSGPSAEVSYMPPVPTPAPVLTSVSPGSGPTLGGTVLTLSGNNFTGSSSVRVNGVLATSVSLVGGQLRATTPAGTAGPVSVRVINADGQWSELNNAFTYVGAPALSSVSPSSGAVAGGTAVTLNGSNFSSSVTVRFDGALATSVVRVSASQITAVTPQGSTGPANVEVTNNDGQATPANSMFTYVAAPTLSSVSPSSGTTAGGTAITVNGSNFSSGVTVRVDGALASSVVRVNGSQLTAVTPAGAAGPADVQVTNSDGQSVTGAGVFTYVAPASAPTLTSISPASGTTAGGTAITLNGGNFTSSVTVRIGNVAATSVVRISSSQITAVTPAGAAGATTVQVVNSDNLTATRNSFFTYVAPAPTLSSIGPSSGPTSGGTRVTLTGSNFSSNPTVRIGSALATSINRLSATQLEATTAAGTAGAASVVVTNGDGQAVTRSSFYTYVAPNSGPTLTSVSPASGPTTGGTRITLMGVNFSSGAMVHVGGAPATSVTRVSSTQLDATTPQGTAGAAAVQVTNSDNRTSSLPNAFTYTQASNDDTDGDGMPNVWELQFGLNPNSPSGNEGANGDPDGDGVSNLTEYQRGTHPRGFQKKYLAEGAVNTFFNTRLAIANPQTSEAKVLLSFGDSNGRTTRRFVSVPARSRRTVDAGDINELNGTSFATSLESDQVVVLDRLMAWAGRNGYAAHAETALDSPSTTWYLAEGATGGPFELFYLIQNPSAAAAELQIRYLLPNGRAPIVKTYTVDPGARFTVWVDNEDSALASTDVSAEITSTNNVPVIVERSMYLNTWRRAFKGGHASAAVPAPALKWFLAEGLTGSYFSMYVLLANPTNQTAEVKATFILDSGAPVVKTYTVNANSRYTVDVSSQHRSLRDASIAVQVESTNAVPIIVERTMWWPNTGGGWTEGHNAFGTTTTGPRWLVAEGEVGGARAVDTFVLVANTSAAAASVKVTVLFENGAEQSQTYTVGANRRFTVPVSSAFPGTANQRFSVLVESLNPATAGALVVERAMYWNTDDEIWGAGSNAVGTRLP